MAEISEFAGWTAADVIARELDGAYIVDLGVVKIAKGTLVDVEHATKDGGAKVMSYNVELLFPSSASCSISWDIKAGDVVLLLGFRRYVRTVARLSSGAEATPASPYSRATVKAIPIGQKSAQSSVKIHATNSDVTITTSKIKLDGDVEVTGNIKVAGDGEVSGNMKVSGDSTLQGSLQAGNGNLMVDK